MIRTTLKVISATTKVILTTEEVITAILKVISATKKVIIASEEVITDHLENYVSHYKSDLFYCSIFLATDRNSRFLISDMHVQNKKYGNCVSISRLTGKCVRTKNKTNFCMSSLWTCLHHMVILRSEKKITDLLMILG